MECGSGGAAPGVASQRASALGARSRAETWPCGPSNATHSRPRPPPEAHTQDDPRARSLRAGAGVLHGGGAVRAAAVGRASGRRQADAGRTRARLRAAAGAGHLGGVPGLELGDRRLLGAEHRREQRRPEAAALQDHRHLGEPRGVHPALGADPRPVRRRGRRVRAGPALGAAGAGDRRAGRHLGRLPAVRADHVQPVQPGLAAADGRAGDEPAAAGPRPRLPPAGALRGLCRLRGAVRLRGGGAAGGPDRRLLGPLGAALGAGVLVPADLRHRAGLMVGVLRARLGRLLVLGPGGERLADALAHRHRAGALGDRGGESARA